MKKALTVFMLLIFLIFMSSCGASGTSDEKTPSVPESSSSAVKPAETPKQEQKDNEPEADYTLKDYVVADNEQCQFKINEVKDKKGTAEFSIYCENRTEDKTLMFSVENCVVNGCAIDPFWAGSVAPGKKANDTFTFSKTQLEQYDLSSVDELRFKLNVYDYDDWFADKFVEEEFIVYPTGKTEGEVTPVRRSDESTDVLIVDNDDLKYVICESGEGTFWAYYITVYMENKTDSPLMFSWRDVSVNGYMCDPFYATSVPAHSCFYSDVTFSTSAFEENGIGEVEEIEFSLNVYDEDSWMTDYLNETFTYKP